MRRATAAALFCAGLGVLLVASAPAVLLDAALDRASAGRFRLALAEGTLWNGQARLASADSSASLSPITRLRWEFQPAALARARLRWRLTIDGGAPSQLEIGSGGVALQHLALQLPPATALAAVPHPIARIGWRGVLDIKVPALACAWNGRCEGGLQAEWRAGGVDILPGQAFGDHRIVATITAPATTLEITALRGIALAVNGKVELGSGRRPRVELEIGGNAPLLGRLEGLLAELRPARDGERLRIRF
ncbi:MAG: type II secretion system protein N [Thauera sp.]|nr:type II secretion system protein N [Thauera sp.]